MGRGNERVQALESQPKRELKALFGEELNGASTHDITNSRRNDFMRACYEQLDVDESPFVKVD